MSTPTLKTECRANAAVAGRRKLMKRSNEAPSEPEDGDHNISSKSTQSPFTLRPKKQNKHDRVVKLLEARHSELSAIRLPPDSLEFIILSYGNSRMLV